MTHNTDCGKSLRDPHRRPLINAEEDSPPSTTALETANIINKAVIRYIENQSDLQRLFHLRQYVLSFDLELSSVDRRLNTEDLGSLRGRHRQLLQSTSLSDAC